MSDGERIAGELVPSWASEADRAGLRAAESAGRWSGIRSGLRILGGFAVLAAFVVVFLLMLSTEALGQPGRSPSPGFGSGPVWDNLGHPTLWRGIYDPKRPHPPVDLDPASWAASVVVPPLPGLVGAAPFAPLAIR